MAENKIRTGIVFSGGIAKGAYQIGFCRAFAEHPAFEVGALSSASIGTLNGYALLSGRLDSAERLWRSVDIKGCKKVYEKILHRRKIYEFIDDLCDEKKEITTPFYTVCLLADCMKSKYIKLDNLDYETMKDCLKASISIPKLVEPVLVNGERLCDGAVADNTPITPLFNHELDLIISVQFDAHMPNLSEISTGQAVCPVLFLNLHNGSAFKDSFDLECSRVNGMINYGYDVSDDILTLIESRYCHGTYERFIRLISYCNSQLKESRRSGDYIVRKINKVSNILH